MRRQLFGKADGADMGKKVAEVKEMEAEAEKPAAEKTEKTESS